jgi:hypothetical protein
VAVPSQSYWFGFKKSGILEPIRNSMHKPIGVAISLSGLLLLAVFQAKTMLVQIFSKRGRSVLAVFALISMLNFSALNKGAIEKKQIGHA